VIRAATAADGPALQAIEIAAGARFRDVGLAAIAEHDPFPLAELAAYAAAGRSWVAVDVADAPVGYAVADVVDGCGHLEQVSVLPERQGTGIGRALVETVCEWAARAGHPAVTLTTFADVAWNGPLYAHLGFRVLEESEVGPELAALRADEARHGLDPELRVCMRRDLAPPSARPAPPPR